MRLAIALLAVLALAGCGSSPKTHYFALSPLKEAPRAPVALAWPVTVASIEIPPTLDRRQMVRQTGATTMQISDQDRWTAPLGDMTRLVLSQDLAALLPPNMMVAPDLPAPPQTRRIVVAIDWFGTDASNDTSLVGSWSLLEGNPAHPVLRREISLKVGGGVGQAAAMSRLVALLAQRIATTLDDLPAARRTAQDG